MAWYEQPRRNGPLCEGGQWCLVSAEHERCVRCGRQWALIRRTRGKHRMGAMREAACRVPVRELHDREEQSVMRLVREGRPYREIAAELGCSKHRAAYVVLRIAQRAGYAHKGAA